MGAYGKDAQRHHLDYIQRDSAAREGEKGILYSRDEVFLDGEEFHERGIDDRHQFRVIVSPEDGKELGDLRTYTRNVMAQMERDLGTRLDWVAANHYDTANPHSHVVIRGVTDTGSTLIIPRDYISHGMREAAEHIATLELGPSNQIDVAKKLALSVRHDRLTSIDRDLLAKAENQIVDLSKLPLDGSDWSQRFEKFDRSLNGEPIYDTMSNDAKPVTGRVIEKGILDDVNDRSYIVLDTQQGEALFVETGREANISEIEPGMVVTAGPQSYAPKSSDHTIYDIASKRSGIYSPSHHEMSDPSAREEFIKAHVRRLEAMRRLGRAERNSDGSWTVPKDYLKRAAKYERSRELIQKSSGVTQGTLDALEKLDLDAAGKALSDELAKPYKPAPQSGRMSGLYRQAIQRPSGKYAVIEKSKEFTLVPWRETMDRNF